MWLLCLNETIGLRVHDKIEFGESLLLRQAVCLKNVSDTTLEVT